jgi:hypothetical protein
MSVKTCRQELPKPGTKPTAQSAPFSVVLGGVLGSCPLAMSTLTQRSPWIASLGCLLLCAFVGVVSSQACTMFVLANADRVLFGNNEDCKKSDARVWFVPGKKTRLGCVYVGLRNQWAQGGMNTKGLAFDGVTGMRLDGLTNTVPIRVQPHMKRVRGNPSERMLESCGSVEEAIAFYQGHKEPTFSYATIMLADRSGAFAVIGTRDGRLHVLRGDGCTAWGWNGPIASRLISRDPTPTVTNAASILDAARSRDDYPTRYSNLFDLSSGGIVLFDFSRTSAGTTLGLIEELAKGRHFYDMRDIREQLSAKPKHLSRLREWEKNIYCWFHGNG